MNLHKWNLAGDLRKVHAQKGCQYSLTCFDRFDIKRLLLLPSFISTLIHVGVVVPVNIRSDIYHWNVHFPLNLDFSQLVQKKVLNNYLFLREIQRLTDAFSSASAFALSLWDGLWPDDEMVPLKYTGVCCQAHPILSACNSICVAFWCIATGRWSGPKLDSENKPHSGTSFYRLHHPELFVEILCGVFLLQWISVGFSVPLLVLNKYLELEKLR